MWTSHDEISEEDKNKMDPKKAKELDDLTKLLVDALDTKTTIKPDPKPVTSPLAPQEDDNYNLGKQQVLYNLVVYLIWNRRDE